MRRAFVIAVALAAAGCGDPKLDELRAIRDEVCACKTSACGEEAKKRVPQDVKDWDHRAQRAAREMVECLAKLYLKERPSNDPDAETPEGTPAAGAPAEGAPAAGAPAEGAPAAKGAEPAAPAAP